MKKETKICLSAEARNRILGRFREFGSILLEPKVGDRTTNSVKSSLCLRRKGIKVDVAFLRDKVEFRIENNGLKQSRAFEIAVDGNASEEFIDKLHGEYESLLEALRKEQWYTERVDPTRAQVSAPGVVYVVEPGDGYGYVGPFSTFAAALGSVKEIAADEAPPSICRRRIDDHPHAATLVADLSRSREIVDVQAKGGPDVGLRRDWAGDLSNGYAYVPHPFKRGDIIRQGDSYYVLDESVEESDGRFSWGMDDCDMVLYGMSWDKKSGSFGHEHIDFTRHGTELVAPADLPERQRMLAAVSVVMRDGHALIEFLQCFTNGYRNELEKNTVKWAECENASLKSSWTRCLRGDMPTSVVMRKAVPGLPVNLFIPSKYHVHPVSIRVQRSVADEPNYRDTVEMTLEAEPQFFGGTGDLSPAEVDAVRDFVVRNLDPLLSYWNEKISFDDLLDTLRQT